MLFRVCSQKIFSKLLALSAVYLRFSNGYVVFTENKIMKQKFCEVDYFVIIATSHGFLNN